MPRFADGSVSNERMAAAAVRSTESWQRVIRKCDQIMEDLDEVTSPGHPLPLELNEEDSAVHVITEAIGAVSSRTR